ncbi:hypothetical protein EDF31_101461 [Curtobacterium sp. PhB142]|uniref:hypothetical protein n=1 Tax=unclassified Curtobacterium TaxID=257496 RepID=UPI00104E5049|nr:MULTISPECIES: hypothetical protein [unclassified Curtobacterium]TCL88617.1 hypothetical protein EDF31_101461 [Curtobacterium sp. PhB142]TCM04020.1 hypothetical protein EDF26_102233 [Curtobacterium sp. PhB134]
MSERNRPTVRLLAAVVVAGSVAVLATGCSFVQQQTGDAWSVTYEVSVDQPSGAALTDVRVEGAEKRGDAPEVHRLGTQETGTQETSTQKTGIWEHESIVLAEQRASVRATPARGAAATCRILLDGKREIATETAAAGEPVTCSVDTPAFD